MIPMKKLAEPADVANACIYLLSGLSGITTGSSLKVDGGWDCGPTEKLLELVTGDASAPG